MDRNTNDPYSHQPGDRIAQVDIGYLIETLFHNRLLILFWTFLMTALAVLLALLLSNQYTASARILIDPQPSQLADLKLSETKSQINESVIESKTYALRSNRLLERVVDELGLHLDPNFVIMDDAGEAMSRRLAMKTLNESLTIRQAGISFVLNIEATTNDPVISADIANTVANTFVTLEREAKLDTARQANEWLLNRLKALQEQVSASSAELENFRAVSGVAVERRISDLSQYLERLRMSMSEVARDANEQNGQAADVRGANLAGRIKETEAQLRELTSKTVELRELERQADADRQLYERFLDRAKELDELQNFQVADSRVIADALQPLLPSGPRRRLIVILGAIFGTAIGVGIVALREMFTGMRNIAGRSSRVTDTYAEYR